jgi:hypothetical protein
MEDAVLALIKDKELTLEEIAVALKVPAYKARLALERLHVEGRAVAVRRKGRVYFKAWPHDVPPPDEVFYYEGGKYFYLYTPSPGVYYACEVEGAIVVAPWPVGDRCRRRIATAHRGHGQIQMFQAPAVAYKYGDVYVVLREDDPRLAYKALSAAVR